MATSGGAEGIRAGTNTLAAHVPDSSRVRDPVLTRFSLMLLRCADGGKVEGSSERRSNLNKSTSGGTSVLLRLCLSSSALSLRFCSGRVSGGNLVCGWGEGGSEVRVDAVLITCCPPTVLLQPAPPEPQHHLSLILLFREVSSLRSVLTLSPSV